MANPLSGYHAAHLSKDAARAAVWKVVAEQLASWVAPEARRGSTLPIRAWTGGGYLRSRITAIAGQIRVVARKA
jgi:hypothetical protein